MASYPKDRFDELPEDLKRVGAHRGPAKRGRGWIGFAWAALATGVLIFGGLFGLSKFLGIDVGLPIFDAAPPAETATPTPIPVVTAAPAVPTDPAVMARALRVAVLNGTPVAGLQNTVGDALAAATWVVDTRANASTKDVATTTVYYSDAANEDVARGIVATLGVGQVRLVSPETFPGTPLTLVIGLDYPGAVPAA